MWHYINCTTGFVDFNNRGSYNLSPQLGVTIIDDNVHIGASCTIDRGKIDVTYIGKNSMIDNMVHIAHNVIIGKAHVQQHKQVYLKVKLETMLLLGQAGFIILTGKNVIIAAKSGVTKYKR